MHRLWSPFARGWPSAGRIRAFRERKLAGLIRHAAARVPVYRRRFREAGVDPVSIRSLGDLPVIPLFGKEELKAVPRDQRITEGVDAGRLRQRHTSGSTGIPFSIYRSPSEERVLGLYRFRALRAMGMRVRDMRIGLEFFGRRPGGGLVPGWMQKLGVMPRRKIDCTQSPEGALAMLRETRADIVGGYAGFLYLLSEMAGAGGLAGIGARIVTSTGEVLTPEMRARIVESFEAPVLDTYSSLECNMIAHECAETGLLHLLDHSVVVEVLRNGLPVGTGERGELVVTALHSRTAPFIRYRIGDIATKGPERCPCGAPFGTIRAIEGRMNDLFTLPDGRRVHPAYLKAVLHGAADWARQFRIQQEARGRVLALIVPRREPSEVELGTIETGLREALPDDVGVEVRLVQELRPDPSGKHRAVFTRVSSSYDDIDWETL